MIKKPQSVLWEETIPATLFYQMGTSSSKIARRGNQNGELCLLQVVLRRRMEKLTQKDRRRLRQCEVVIWRLLHKKAGLDYGDYSREWQSWFDDLAIDLGKVLIRFFMMMKGISG